MTLLPNHYETFVLTRPSKYVLSKIAEVTSPKSLMENQEGKNALFTGWFGKDRFRISMKISRPNNYVPLVIGQIENTSSGSLLFINYTLFPSTKMFFIFWNLFILLAGLIAGYQYSNLAYPAIAFALISLIHWIAWSNFKIQLRFTRQLLLGVLT